MNAVFANGTTLAIQSYHVPLDIILLADDPDDMIEKWALFSASGALDTLQITDSSGSTVATFYGCVITGVQSVINSDGTLTVHFYMYETGSAPEESVLTEEDASYIAAAKILLGEEV